MREPLIGPACPEHAWLGSRPTLAAAGSVGGNNLDPDIHPLQRPGGFVCHGAAVNLPCRLRHNFDWPNRHGRQQCPLSASG